MFHTGNLKTGDRIWYREIQMDYVWPIKFGVVEKINKKKDDDGCTIYDIDIRENNGEINCVRKIEFMYEPYSVLKSFFSENISDDVTREMMIKAVNEYYDEKSEK